MEEADSDDSRGSVITVESNVSDDVIFSGQENVDNVDVVIVQHEDSPAQGDPRAATSSGLGSQTAEPQATPGPADPQATSSQTGSEPVPADEPVGSSQSVEAWRTGVGETRTNSTDVEEARSWTSADTARHPEDAGHGGAANLPDGVDPPSGSEEVERSSQSSAEDSQSASVVSTTSPSLLSSIKEFISGTDELTRLDCLNTASLAQRSSDPDIMGILRSLHQSLSSIVRRADPSGPKVSE
ncbi:hypothetical protein EGW08_015334 [Elysia chlorotica]|uniref:Uncharacterized protein n=1 Tax=Elysia chlorotica TaxID=188477 RepID=A0A433T5R1_ELYCH|nr:hypothetical protein EGW08_015334 [Elysia chlorotica]